MGCEVKQAAAEIAATNRPASLPAWGRLAILGGFSVLLSAILAHIAVTRLMAEVSRHL